jgi:energy-coupling factor transporter transmembrane protein EcfT
MANEKDREIVFSLFKTNLKTIGVVSFSTKLKGLKRFFMTPIILLSLFFVFGKGYPMWWLLMPLVPMVMLWVFYIVDLNIMVQSLISIQKILISDYNLVYDMNQLFEYLQLYAEHNDYFKIGKG